MSEIKEILEFWFGTPDDADYGQQRKIWFTKNSEFDQKVRSLFTSQYQQAATGQLDEWKTSPQSCLALIILLDQFPRNMFRGQPKSFATDFLALAYAQHAITQGFDQELPTFQRWFVYMPFEHSENIEHQYQSIDLFKKLSDQENLSEPLDYANRHFKVIERFGRYPHRNQILGRETTPEEAEFLKQPGSSF
jgi:uncharacterized protein (DUF924 family)